jgi:hypothetical protein
MWPIRGYRRRSVSVTADADSNREVRFGEHRTSREQCRNQQFRFHDLFPPPLPKARLGPKAKTLFALPLRKYGTRVTWLNTTG